uniref:Ig-like domain-containing protein n=1 Tax=Amphilophus citrinellus TaxID=61819 RepID=A0A3Q0SZY0_AMPCI
MCKNVFSQLQLIIFQTELTVKRGEDATLQCYGPTDATIVLLRWEKPDLQSHLYVFYFRDRRPNENYQIPRFKGRVKLKEPEMKNGDFTVILKNVSMNDAGIYECQVGYKNQKPQLINSINLTVEEPGEFEVKLLPGLFDVSYSFFFFNNKGKKTDLLKQTVQL